jgi:hypothetical protein
MIPKQGVRARATVRLTKRAVDQAEPLSKPYFVWDGELRGFGVRIDPGGAKTFAVRYRPKGHGASAPKRFITIGRYGALTVEEARNRAKEILGAVATGEDPAADLALRRAASTFKDIADLFLREHVGLKRKTSTAQDYESLLTNYAIPALGNRKAGVTRAEVARLHGQIGDRPYQANRLLAVMGISLNVDAARLRARSAAGSSPVATAPRISFARLLVNGQCAVATDRDEAFWCGRSVPFGR